MTETEKIIEAIEMMQKQNSTRPPRKTKMPFRKKMIIGITTFLVLYTIIQIYLFVKYQIEMTSLTIAVFGAATGEYWQLGKIQEKIQEGRNKIDSYK